MTTIELLAPARTADIGIEAITHGADAVYIGGPSFGARHAAGNSIDDIARLCRYGQPYGVPVYVTLNTLLHDDEYVEAERIVRRLYEVGVSALIIQDANLLSLDLPPIALHASTQMDNSTAAKVRALHEAGFAQTVVARELDINQIRDIHHAVPEMRLEAFVHGALCVGASGLCHASEHLFGRSADRGECAQVCRLRFDLVDSCGNIIVRDRHLLSLRDMNRTAQLEAMMDAGVNSFKIEGRLKDATYVKNITAHYRREIDKIIARRKSDYCRSSYGIESYSFDPDPTRSFNRGFTPYLDSNTDILSPFTPKAVGQEVGHVRGVTRNHITLSLNTTAQLSSIVAGDGLCFFDSTMQLQGFRANNVEGDKIFPRPMPSGIAAGMVIYRNLDHAFNRQLEKSTSARTIDIDICISDVEGGFALRAQRSNSDTPPIVVTTEHPHEISRRSQSENIHTQLSRLGNTPYTAHSITINFTDEWFIPSSLLSDMRRRMVEALNDQGYELLRGRHKASPRPSQPLNLLVDCRNQKDYSKLMICRLCLRRELGLCPQHKSGTGLLLPFIEQQPKGQLRLRMSDGRELPLSFDCQHCNMIVYA